MVLISMLLYIIQENHFHSHCFRVYSRYSKTSWAIHDLKKVRLFHLGKASSCMQILELNSFKLLLRVFKI